MRRFFIEPEAIEDGRLTILGQDAHHITNVLRLKAGDKVAVSDGAATVYEVELTEVGKNRVAGTILTAETVEPDQIKLTVFQGLPKGKKMDFIVEKLTEIGVAGIVPVEMARSVAEYDGARGAKKLERWRAIAVEAAKQSKRVTVPEIGEIAPFKKAVEAMRDYDAVIVPWEEEAASAVSIIEATHPLAPSPQGRGNKIALLIGPEGGIEQAEIDALLAIGANTVTLGKTILRTETAGLVASALILLGR